MKRKIISIACICLTICCSCGNTESSSEPSVDPVSEKISNDIDSIGEVTIEDKELIETIEKTYSTLTESQKNGVTNYADLLNARDELNRIIKEDEAKQAKAEEKAKAEEQAKKNRYTADVKFCVKAFVSLQEVLKNPDSLQINDFAYDKYEGKRTIRIDTSAQNGFGGTNRDVIEVTDDSTFATLYYKCVQTNLYVKKSDIYDTDSVAIFSKTDGIDHQAVYDLYEEYKSSGDFSILE